MLCWIRLETNNWEHELTLKKITEVIIQVKIRVILSYA